MKRINRVYLGIVFLVLVGLLVLLFFFFTQNREERLRVLGDHIISNFQAGLAYEMTDLLSFSLALSEDGELKNALIADDEAKGHEILSQITERFKKYTHIKSLHIQLITPEFFVFARSWDEGYEGMPIWWFRDDLEKFKTSKRPKVGMEVGRLLTFKATIPVYSGKTLLGYLEVIKFVDSFVAKMSKRGIALLVLMDEKFLPKAELMRDYPRLHNYVIANQSSNPHLLKQAKALSWDKLEQQNYLYVQDRFYLLEPMYNGEREEIGKYLLILSSKAIERYEQINQGFSFFTQFSDEDIEQVVASWQHPYGSFRNGYDKELVEVLPKLSPEDKVEFEAEAKEILHKYTKEELIDIILDNAHNEKKVGIIQ